METALQQGRRCKLMRERTTPSNIVGAALLMQFSIYLVIAITLAILPNVVKNHTVLRGDEYTAVRTSKTYWIVFALFLITFALLFFSDAFTSIWGPMYKVRGLVLITWSSSLLFVFLSNYGLIGALCYFTGLSKSPFLTIILALPALAVFLSESTVRVVWYVALSTGLVTTFTYLGSKSSGRDLSVRWRTAQVVVTASTLAFGTWIGLITRI